MIHYLEKGDAGQQHILKIVLGLLYPNGYDGTCTPKATCSQGNEMGAPNTMCSPIIDKSKNENSKVDEHGQKKQSKSKYKSKTNGKFGKIQKLKFPRVNKRKSTFIKKSKGANKTNNTSKIKIGNIPTTNLNEFSNAMAFYNRLLLKWLRVKFKNKLH